MRKRSRQSFSFGKEDEEEVGTSQERRHRRTSRNGFGGFRSSLLSPGLSTSLIADVGSYTESSQGKEE